MADEACKEFPGDEPDERNPTGYISDNINEMVSTFLEGLADICSETNHVSQPDADGDSEILPSDEAVRAKSKPDLFEIRNEVGETRIKSEHLISEFVSPPAAKLNVPQSGAEPAAPNPVVEPSQTALFDSAEAKMWEGMEILRSSIAYSSSSFFQRQKHLMFALAAVALIMAFGGIYLLWMKGNPQVSEIFEQIRNSKRQYVQISENQTSSTLSTRFDLKRYRLKL